MLVESTGDVEPFGTQLRTLRERAGLTQEELAERAGLSPHAVSALERGVRTRPYPHTVRSIASALSATDGQRAALVASVPGRGRQHSPAQGQPAPQDAPQSPPLVVPPTRLYGRQQDVERLVAVVRSGETRLVTLTGPGGVGKTRLLAAVSHALADDFPEGSVHVALAPLIDAAAVVPTTARAFGLNVSDGPEATTELAQQLAGRQVLLVLDNFEHLLAAAPEIGVLSASCPDLMILASSRAPLRVRAEHEFPVVPLSLPAREGVDVVALAESAAGALILDRAGGGTPRAVADDDAPLLGALCWRLAGLPLALELAAAHLRHMSPGMILERLDELMAAPGARDLPARQQTLRATLDWSYQLLSPAQQNLFRTLGTFRAGACVDQVQEVCTLSGMSPMPVLVALEALAEHSLLTFHVGPDGLVRFEMLEPVAEYAQSLLTGDEAARVNRAHGAAFLALIERAAQQYEQRDQVWWLARTASDEANILVALDRALDADDADTAGRITWAMWLYWWLRAQVRTGARAADLCLEKDLPPALRARVHLAAATMAYASGNLTASARHWQHAASIGRDEHDPEVSCKAVAGLGLAALGHGDLDGSAAHLREAVDLSMGAGAAGVWMRSLAHVWLGTVLLLQGQTVAAEGEIIKGLQIGRQQGDRLTTYVALYNLAGAAISAADKDLARTYLDEGIRLSQQTQDHANLAYFLESLAVVERHDGQATRVAVLTGAAQALRDEAGVNVYGYYLPDTKRSKEALEWARKTLGQDTFDDAVDAGRALEADAAVQFSLRDSPATADGHSPTVD